MFSSLQSDSPKRCHLSRGVATDLCTRLDLWMGQNLWFVVLRRDFGPGKIPVLMDCCHQLEFGCRMLMRVGWVVFPIGAGTQVLDTFRWFYTYTLHHMLQLHVKYILFMHANVRENAVSKYTWLESGTM